MTVKPRFINPPYKITSRSVAVTDEAMARVWETGLPANIGQAAGGAQDMKRNRTKMGTTVGKREECDRTD